MKEINRDIELAKKRNLIVTLNGLQDPYFFGDDNTEARWSNTDIGRLFANKALNLPVELKMSDQELGMAGRLGEVRKKAIQEYFRLEFFSALRNIEHYRKTREEAMISIVDPAVLVDMNPITAEAYFRTTANRYPSVHVDDILHATLALEAHRTSSEESPALYTIGLAVKKGAQEYIRLKTANDIGKRIPWKVHREYDLILMFLVDELEEEELIPEQQNLREVMLEDLARDNYKGDANGH